MTEGLLQTKLQIPILRAPSLVSRPRLFEKLNAGLYGDVTLVAAPAGFGKTTLVAEWVRRGARFPGAANVPMAAWLSLDEQDNDPACFLAYMAAALERVVDDAALLQGPQAPPLEGVMTLLINEIGRAPEPFLLVLDDYHLIKEQQIHDLMTFLLGHLPPSIHLVLCSRSDPPLHLARLRGQGALNDVRQSDLCFTIGETKDLLNKVLDLDLTADDLGRLNRRTEGWAAGLQMAAISLRQREDPAAFIQDFAGSNRYILDYLMEEVLARQSPDIQQFMLATSVLERLSAPLCDALLTAVPNDGPQGSVETLEFLDAANLFVVPLDDQRQWYRYHRLFSDLLRQRLQQTAPQLVSLLHVRARDWYWQEGWPVDAVAHALQAGDEERAAQMIEEAAELALQKSQIQTVLGWMRALPEDQVRKRPRLSLYHLWALFLSGAPVEQVEADLPQPADAGADLTPEALLMHAFIASLRGRMAQGRNLARRALDGLGPQDRFSRSMAVWILSFSARDPMFEGRDDKLGWEDAVRFARESGNLLVMVSAMSEQAHAQKRRGHLHEARDIFAQALAAATPVGERSLPIAGEALVGLAEIDLEWNDLAGAEAQLTEGLALTREWREVAALPACFQLARLRQAQGDGDGANAALREAARLAVLFDATELDDAIVAAYQARLWIMQGRPHLAQTWVTEYDLEGQANEHYGALRPFVEMVLARLKLAQGDLDAAENLEDHLLPVFTGWQHTRLIIENLLLRALVHAQRGDVDKALDDLAQALALGEPGGFVRIFVDEGEAILRLLQRLQEHDQVSRAYVARLIAAFGAQDAYATEARPQPLIEPLSERELEILRLIAEGLSNREIGQRLYLSLPTVKWHSSNIYGKLGVKNRTTAVAKARELGIL